MSKPDEIKNADTPRKPDPKLSEARQIVEEYIRELREIIRRLRQRLH